MAWFLPLIVIGGLLFCIARARRRPGRDVEAQRQRLRSPLANLVGIPVERVRDVRLAAVILMLQLTRTGSPITTAEKTQILAFMKEPLGVESIADTFEVAWSYTRTRQPFALLADALLPLLRERLTPDERLHLIDMLFAVASAHSPTGELQRKAILGLERKLLAASPADSASRIGGGAR